MRIFLTDVLGEVGETLETEGLRGFFEQYLTWNYWETKIPLIGNFAGRVLLAILVYVIASKLIHKLCKIIVASMKRANADTGVKIFIKAALKPASLVAFVKTLKVETTLSFAVMPVTKAVDARQSSKPSGAKI